MPLRSLFYVSRVLQRLTVSENLYGSRLIPLPAPQFVVFYNGSTKRPELREYMLYCDKLRERRKTEELDIAVEHTVNECIKERILKKFLMENKAEVRAMTIFEYDQEEHIRMERAEAREEGIEKGIALKLISLVCSKIKKDKTIPEIAEALEEDESVIRKICEIAGTVVPRFDADAILEELKKTT